jgi:hypothetical protein
MSRLLLLLLQLQLCKASEWQRPQLAVTVLRIATVTGEAPHLQHITAPPTEGTRPPAQHHHHHSTSQQFTAHHSTAQHITSHHITSQHITSQHSTAQHSTAHHSTSQHIKSLHSTSNHFTAHHTCQANNLGFLWTELQWCQLLHHGRQLFCLATNNENQPMHTQQLHARQAWGRVKDVEHLCCSKKRLQGRWW